jgi:aspartate racemase
MLASIPRSVYGIIGGMGPLASLRLLQMIYRKCRNIFESERDFPRIVLIADTMAPDRAGITDCEGRRRLVEFLESKLGQMRQLGADKILMACFVAHACIPELKTENTKKLIDLVSILRTKIMELDGAPLVLAADTFYRMKFFSENEVKFPSWEDRREIQKAIEIAKVNDDLKVISELADFCDKLSAKYNARATVLACSDLSVVQDARQKISQKVEYIDALGLAADCILKSGKASAR